MNLLSYAKLNLGLKVINRRDDHFHNIFSLFHPIALQDTLNITEQEEQHNDIAIHSELQLPQYFNKQIQESFTTHIQSNLMYKAYHWFYKNFLPVAQRSPIKISIIKKIPSPCGLGGGSSNAAGVLLYLWEKYHKSYNLSKKDLMLKSIELGSDVPFFIKSQTAIIHNKGDILEYLPSSEIHGILLIPNKGFATKEVYQHLNYALQNITKKKYSIDFLKEEVYSLYNIITKKFSSIVYNTFLEEESNNIYYIKNDLLQSCMYLYEKEVKKMFPIIQKIIKYIHSLDQKGNIFYSMSGSGSTFYILTPVLDLNTLQIIKNKFSKDLSTVNLLLF